MQNTTLHQRSISNLKNPKKKDIFPDRNQSRNLNSTLNERDHRFNTNEIMAVSKESGSPPRANDNKTMALSPSRKIIEPEKPTKSFMVQNEQSF